MDLIDGQVRSSWSPSLRAKRGAIITSLGLYILLFPPLYPIINHFYFIIGLIPIIAAGLLLGFRGAIYTVIAVSGIHFGIQLGPLGYPVDEAFVESFPFITLLVGGSIGYLRDLRTKLNEQQEELKRYETLVEVSGDPMYMLDAEGCFTYVNDALVEITGYSKEELLGEHGLTVVPEEQVEKGEELIQTLLSSGEQHGTFELEVQTKTGETIPAEIHVSLIDTDDAFRGSVGVLRDVTDRLERERQLQRERDRLDRFASVVSHDLINMLNVATGRLELAMEDRESEHLEPVSEVLSRMQTLIDDVLRLAKAGETVGETQTVALAEQSDTCWRNVETRSAELRIETDAAIRADETRLKQLFENLFRNAVEYGGDDVTVTVGELDDGFYVEDDGPGIPEGDREAVFETAYSGQDNGTGFGLSIVKEIVRGHDWKIRVTDGSEGGARFEITGVEFIAE